MGSLERALSQSKDLSSWLQASLSEQGPIDSDQKTVIALALYMLALELRESGLLLALVGSRASCAVIARPALEAYIRGLWVQTLSSPERLSRFLHGQDLPTIETMFKDLRKATKSHHFEVLRSSYRVLCDYAHAGPRQIAKWIHPGEIAPKYEDEHTASVLHLLNIIGLMAARSKEDLMGKSPEVFDARLMAYSTHLATESL